MLAAARRVGRRYPLFTCPHRFYAVEKREEYDGNIESREMLHFSELRSTLLASPAQKV
jgi:hypothetical protein